MSMAIKYQMSKRAKEAARGEPCEAHGADMCEMCHGGKAMADGGYVDEEEVEPSPSPSPSPRPVVDQEKAKKFSTAFKGFAEGGEVDEGLVERIMHKRGNTPGAEANYTGPHVEFEDNQFDDLVKDNNMGTAADYTGANSGDELGNAQEDEDRRDIISMVMKSRRKKDRLPNPR